jgi:hypothetical protein
VTSKRDLEPYRRGVSLPIVARCRTPFDPVLPCDVLLWRVVKAGRMAQAVIRLLPGGRELRVYVGQELAWARLFHDHEDSRVLGEMADGCLADFRRTGWRRVLEE